MIMHRRIVYIIPLMISLVATRPGYGQASAGNDTLITDLKRIRSKDDSALVRRSIARIGRSPESLLLQDNIWTEIQRIRNLATVRDYTDLSSSYMIRLLALNTTASNEKAISFGDPSLENILNARNEYEYRTSLWVFRELRSAYRNLGKLNESLEYYGKAERAFLAKNDSSGISIANNVLSGSYFRIGMPEKAVYHQGKSVGYLNEQVLDPRENPVYPVLGAGGKMNRYAVLAGYYLSDGKLQEADSSLTRAMYYYRKLNDPKAQQDVPYLFLQRAIIKGLKGDPDSQQAFDTCYAYMIRYNLDAGPLAVYFQARATHLFRLDSLDQAEEYLKRTQQKIDSFHLSVIHPWGELIPGYHKALIALKKGLPDEAIRLLEVQLQQLQPLKLRNTLIKVHEALAEAYVAKGNMAQAYNAMATAFTLKTTVVQDEKDARTLSFEMEKKIQENETAINLLNAKDEGNRTIRLYLFGIIASLGVLALALAIFYRNKKKTGEVLASKNLKLEQTLDQLKATQKQLIQSEKMASLGELTAGIAHEIQNPLNFVNNFSEINAELSEEMLEAADQGKIDEVKAIALDIKTNQQKISEHGKRADSIVKSMLQHSRSSSGVKEPTDLNKLADEYLRLAYHGFRAKDKSFNTNITTDLDPAVPAIPVMAQDIGRVMLNLFNNALYAVNEQKKIKGDGYQPEVSLSTEYKQGQVFIRVSDNGSGIPDNIREKIFQPFFTTKPTGQGTGLGLSLSYDIVKAHGGHMKVESVEGEGSSFTISLPQL